MTWGVEAVMLSAGTNVEWLRDDLGLIADQARASHEVAASCRRGAGGVVRARPARPGHAPVGLRRRGTLLGHHPGHRPRPTWCRAVLEGVAHRGADLVEAAEGDAGLTHPTRCGSTAGMTAPTPPSCRPWPSAAGRPVEVSPESPRPPRWAPRFLAGLAIGTWSSLDDVAATWKPARAVDPGGADPSTGTAGGEAVRRASGWSTRALGARTSRHPRRRARRRRVRALGILAFTAAAGLLVLSGAG